MKRIIIATGMVIIYAFAAYAQAPQVVSVTPAQNEVSAAITSNITATFDMDMDPATIDNSTFSIYSRTYGYLSGTVTYDQPSHTATFDPTRDFFHGDVITATLTIGIGSLGGTPMDRGFSWTFTVFAEGIGAFGAFAEYYLNSDPYSVFLADLNMDDYPDIVTGQISVFLNSGEGTFPTRSDYAMSDETTSIYGADFNSDGYIDFCGLNMGSSAYEVVICMNNGDGTFGSPTILETSSLRFNDIVSVDIEGDNDLDLIFSGHASPIPPNLPYFSIFINGGIGDFTYDTSYTINADGTPYALYAGDFNNDGSMDISVTCYPLGLYMFFNDGYGVFSTPPYLLFSGNIYGVAGADLNSDSFMDLAVSTFVDQTLWILMNDGVGNFNAVYNYPTDSRLFNLCSADLNGDQNLDISIVSLKYDSDINTYLFYNNGNGSMNLNSSFNIANSNRIYGVFSSDLDLDGDMDIVSANSSASSITVLKNLPACGYVTGDVNDDGGYNGLDIVYSVNYFKGGPPPLYECECMPGNAWYVAGDVNASCDFNGLDITYGVNYFKGGDAPQPCPECPPAQ